MSTLELPATSDSISQAAERLRCRYVAMRIGFKWFGVRRSLSDQQRQQAAESFGASTEFLSAGKKLIDTRHPAFLAVTQLRSRICHYWKGISLPYPDAGMRLVRPSDVTGIAAEMERFRTELRELVLVLDESLSELKRSARQRLGALYDERDYPENLPSLFALNWDFPSVEPPDYLRQLNPDIYEQESRRIQARFEEAASMAEEAFVDEFSKFLSHLTERLSGDVDGRPKVFRDSALNNLQDFFDRFRRLNVRSNEQLDALVASAQQIVRGVEPGQLRQRADIRQRVATELSAIQSVLEGNLVDRPRRRLIRDSVN